MITTTLKLTAILIALINEVSPGKYYTLNTRNFRQEESFLETIDPKNIDLERLNAVVFHLTNEERAKHNLEALQHHVLLEKAATIHCEEMKSKEFFDHINKKSKKLQDPNDRARFVGITNPFMAENIIESFVLQYKAGQKVYPGPKGVFRHKPEDQPIQPHTYLSLGESMLHDWMNSPQHKANILSKKAKQLGCGSAFYLKEDFNGMPAVLSTQNFQQYETIRVKE